MKNLKLSLATIVALSSSAYAVELENIKVSGQAIVYYNTKDDSAVTGDADKDLFHKDNAKANVGLAIKFEADLGNNFGFGARLNVLETLGLEHNLVSNVMQGVNDVATKENVVVRTSSTETGTAGVSGLGGDEWYWSEAYLTKKMGNTLVKAGRQELNTPLVFSEKWNVMPTTFDAAVIINSDLATSGLTLVGAYVSKSNSHTDLGQFNTLAGGLAVDGAYAIAGLFGNDLIKANAWFYTVPTVANAYWIDANTNVGGVNLTAQLTSFMYADQIIDAKSSDASYDDDTIAVAIKGSYKIDGTTICAAFASTTGGKESHGIYNVGYGTKTKLATSTTVSGDSAAGATDTTGAKLLIKQDLGEYGTAILQYGQYMHGEDSSSVYRDETATVIEAAYKQKVGGIDMLLAYFYDKNVEGWTTKTDEAANTVRVVARYNF